jgi:hypothetical protein
LPLPVLFARPIRRKLPERKPPSASANAPNKNKEERLQGILQHRNINIKVGRTGTHAHPVWVGLVDWPGFWFLAPAA